MVTRVPHLGQWLPLLLATSVSFASTSCRTPAIARQLSADTTRGGDWGQAFTAGRPITLQVPDSGPPLLQLGEVLKGRSGRLFIPDGHGNRILVVDQDGRLLRDIQGGVDSGQFKLTVLGGIALDSSENIYVFDPAGEWVTVLAHPWYRPVRRFELQAPASNFVVLPDRRLVTFFPSDLTAFREYSPDGKQTSTGFEVPDNKLRIFWGRVQGGAVVETPTGDLFGIHPSQFEIVHLSSDLRVVATFAGARNDRWAPNPIPFPDDLDPHDYRPPHERWWNSFLHIGRAYAVSNTLLAVTLYSSQGLGQSRDFVNLYRTDGTVLAEGLTVPDEGHVVGASNRVVYVVRNARLGDRGSMVPLAFYEFHLRDSVR